MSDDKVLRTLRMMFVEKAIGELKAVLNTFWDDDDAYKDYKDLVEKFIKDYNDKF